VIRVFLQSLSALVLLIAFSVILAVHSGGPTMPAMVALTHFDPAALGGALRLAAWLVNGVLAVALLLRLISSGLFMLSLNFVPAARLARALERPGVRRVLQLLIGATLLQQALVQSAHAAGPPSQSMAGMAGMNRPVAAAVQTVHQDTHSAIAQHAPVLQAARAPSHVSFFGPDVDEASAIGARTVVQTPGHVSVEEHAAHAAHAARVQARVAQQQARTIKEVRLVKQNAPAVTFMVRYGGTHLAQVSDVLYGTPAGAARIAAANPGLAPGSLVPEGTMLRVPLDGIDGHMAAVKVVGDHVDYTIQEGDTLSGIAEAFTGNWRNYEHLGVINSDTIKDDNLIYTGNTLHLPSNVLTHYTQTARLVETIHLKPAAVRHAAVAAKSAARAARPIAAPAAVVHHEAAPAPIVRHEVAPAMAVHHETPVQHQAPRSTHAAQAATHSEATAATADMGGVMATWGFAPDQVNGTHAATAPATPKQAATHALIQRAHAAMEYGASGGAHTTAHPIHAVEGLQHMAPSHAGGRTEVQAAYTAQGFDAGHVMQNTLTDANHSLHDLPSVTDGSTNRVLSTTLAATMLALLAFLMFAKRKRVFATVTTNGLGPMGEGMREAVGGVIAGKRGKVEKIVREKVPEDQGNKVVAALRLLESFGLAPDLVCSVVEAKDSLTLAYDITGELDKRGFLSGIETKLPRPLKATIKLERGIATVTMRAGPVLAETPPRAHPAPLLVPLGTRGDDVLHMNIARAGATLIAGGSTRDGAAPLAANLLVNVVTQDPLGARVKIIAATESTITADAISALPQGVMKVVDARDPGAVEALLQDVYDLVRDNWQAQPSDPSYLVLLEGVERLKNIKLLEGLIGQAAQSKIYIIACAGTASVLVDKKATAHFAARIARPLGQVEGDALFGSMGMPTNLAANEAMISVFGTMARVKPFGIGAEDVREHLAQVVAYALATSRLGTTTPVVEDDDVVDSARGDRDIAADATLIDTDAPSIVMPATTDTPVATPDGEGQADTGAPGPLASPVTMTSTSSVAGPVAEDDVFAAMEAARVAARLAREARAVEAARLTTTLMTSTPTVPVIDDSDTTDAAAIEASVPLEAAASIGATGVIAPTDTSASDDATSFTLANHSAPVMDSGAPVAAINIADTEASAADGDATEQTEDDDGARTSPVTPTLVEEGAVNLLPFADAAAAAGESAPVREPSTLPVAAIPGEGSVAQARMNSVSLATDTDTESDPATLLPFLAFEVAASTPLVQAAHAPALAPAPNVEISLIGDPTLRVNGRVVQMRPQSLSILAALAWWGPEPVTKKWLVSYLWQGEAAAANSRRALSTLRGELAAIPELAGHDLLHMTESAIGLNQSLVSVDVYAWKDLYDAAYGLDGPELLEIEQQYYNLYTDDLLGSKGVRGYEWASAMVERYRQFYLRAKRHIAHALDERGDYETALKLSAELIELDPENEAYVILSLGIMSGNGHFEDAERQYQAYVSRLACQTPPRTPSTRVEQIHARTVKKAVAARPAAAAIKQVGRRRASEDDAGTPPSTPAEDVRVGV